MHIVNDHQRMISTEFLNKCIWQDYWLLNIYVHKLHAARFLGGVCQCAFLFSVGFFLWTHVDLLVMFRPKRMWCVVFVFFSSLGLSLCGECDPCTNGTEGPWGCVSARSNDFGLQCNHWKSHDSRGPLQAIRPIKKCPVIDLKYRHTIVLQDPS
jgi:hypothetical protein